MKISVIWIDREHARIFDISEEKMERKRLNSRHPEHHTHARDGLAHEREEQQLFKEVLNEISSADRILILGPGMAKHHLQSFLEEHHPALMRKIAGVETVDHPTDAQIAAVARKFFEKASA